MELNRKDALIGVGVVAGSALLVLFLKGKSNNPSTGGNLSGGTTDIMGGFTTADTVFVPTSSYDIQYNTYKGAVTYSTATNNNQTTSTTTYGPINNNGGTVVATPVTVPPYMLPDAPPHITTTGGHTTNPVPKPPIKGLPKPKPTKPPAKPPTGPNPPKPAPKPAPKPKPVPKPPAKPKPMPAPKQPNKPAWENALIGGVHYTTPKGGWNAGSVVDDLKSHGYKSDMTDRKKLADAMGIKNYSGTSAQNVQMLKNLHAAGI